MAGVTVRWPVGLKLAIDGTMLGLFVCALAFRTTGRAPHEWIGSGFALLLALHLAANGIWFSTLRQGRYGVWRGLNIVIIGALLLCMGLVCVTGILNSRHIFSLSHHFNGETLRALHSLAAYWSLVFIGLHGGLHWGRLKGVFRNIRQCTGIVARILAWLCPLLVLLTGVWASFERDMGSKLFLGFSFDFWDPARPLALLYGANLAIIGLYALLAHYLHKALKTWEARK